MTEVVVKVFDSEDRIQSGLRDQIGGLEKTLKSETGVLASIKKPLLNRKIRNLEKKYEERAVELGSQKPSGYHG